jgi:hypothetical protein
MRREAAVRIEERRGAEVRIEEIMSLRISCRISW